MTLAVLVDPPVVDRLDGNRVQVVELLAPHLPGHDQPGLLEHLEMLHHPETGHLQARFQLGERPAVSLVEQVEKVPTGRVGECLEDPRSEEHTSELQSRENLVCRLLLEKKK